MSGVGPGAQALKAGRLAATCALAGVLLVAGMAIASQGASHPQDITAPARTASSGSVGADTLAAASASLSEGKGPALGHANQCQGAGTGAYRCVPAATPSANISGASWSEVPNMPYARSGALMAYDAADGYVVMFGGELLTPYTQSYDLVNETWTYAAGNWTNLTSALPVAPPPPVGGVFVYDGLDHYLLLQITAPGRVNGSYVYVGESWTYSAGHWTELHPANSPGALSGASAAYDATDRYVLLFGGSSSRSTWAFARGNWSVLNTTVSPWARSGAVMVDDPTAGDVLLSGGEATISGSQVNTNDTWTFSAGNWTQVLPAPPYAPSQKGGLAGAVYDPGSNAILAFVDCYYGTGVYQYSNGTWSNVDACGSIQLVGPVTYDGTDHQTVAVEEYDGSGPDVTWVELYSYANGSFTLVSAPPYLPGPAEGAALADDVGDGYLVYYDQESTLTYNGQVWTGSRSTVEPDDSRCSTGTMTYDAKDGYVLLFCGETWEFKDGNWTKAVQSVSDAWPSASNGPSLAYDAKDGYAVLFGGASDSETWTWSAGNWTNISGSAGVPPSPRVGASMCYDAADGYILLFGGLSPSNYSDSNQTWSFSAGGWSQLQPAVHPSARGYAMITFDEATGNVLLFGGEASSAPGGFGYSYYLGDTWSFAAGIWTNVSSGGGPAPRIEAAMGYSSESDQVVLLGGYGEYYVNPPEWTWGTGAPPPPPVISGFSASPAVTDVNASTTLRVTVLGGAFPLRYNYSGLPLGCDDRNASSLTCTPEGAGAFSIGVRVTDADRNVANATTTVTVDLRPAITAFSIVPGVITLGSSSVLTVNWTGGEPPVTVAYTDLPAGCQSQDVAAFSCQPTQPGAYSVKATITDHRGVSASAVAGLTVRTASNSTPLSLTQFAIEPAAITLGSSVVVTTLTEGGSGTLKYAYSGLPTGCPPTDAAEFFCTPTGSGEFSVGVAVTDQTPVTVRGTALLLVAAAPSGTVNGSGPTITSFTANPSEITVGSSLRLQVQAAGGTPPYTYEYGDLPAGCFSANVSTLTCTPLSAGEFVVSVTVSDPQGQFDQRIAAFSVNPGVVSVPPPVIPPITPPVPPPVVGPQGSIWLVFGSIAAVAVVLASLGVLVSLRRKT